MEVKARIALLITQELFKVSQTDLQFLLPNFTSSQRVKTIPSVYEAFQSIVLECEGYLELIKEASKIFTSDVTQHALGDWIQKVVEGVKVIRDMYSKSTYSKHLYFVYD